MGPLLDYKRADKHEEDSWPNRARMNSIWIRDKLTAESRILSKCTNKSLIFLGTSHVHFNNPFRG